MTTAYFLKPSLVFLHDSHSNSLYKKEF
uniref:Uncharacterized protein n=1 Tax=Arundo donax TaxID=35708 RepID=A0A0A9A799_ARUDO